MSQGHGQIILNKSAYTNQWEKDSLLNKWHWDSWMFTCKRMKLNSYLTPLTNTISKGIEGASLVAQWLRICLPMQGTRVRALVQEDPTCCGATMPVRHNY